MILSLEMGTISDTLLANSCDENMAGVTSVSKSPHTSPSQRARQFLEQNKDALSRVFTSQWQLVLLGLDPSRDEKS